MGRDELIALAERVEGLTGPCRETDDKIYRAATGKVWNDKAYTASLDAAMSLVPRGWIVALYRDFNNDGEYWARCKLTDSFTIGRGCDESEEVSVTSSVGEKRDGDDPTARALTAAALRALAEKQP